MKEIERILRDYPHIPEIIQKLNAELNSILSGKHETYNTLQSAKVTGIPRGTDSSDTVYNAVEKLITRYGERIEEITYQINQWMNIQKAVNDIYYKDGLLTIEERRVIELKYIHLKPWRDIPYIMKYSRRQCERFKTTAIQKFESAYFNMAENGGNIAI